jgi:hypothetical protein
MSRTRVIITYVVAFLVAQLLAIAVHGFILAGDYAAFYGTLLRPMRNAPQAPALFLPVAHLLFIVGFVLIYAKGVEDKPWLGQGLRFGLLAWLVAPAPMYLIWYAEQPWPASLAVKQLALELVTMLVLGVVVAAMYRPRVHAAA